MRVLVTGGLGYIGSHVVVELVNSDMDVVVIDNLSNSDISVLDSIYDITGKQVPFYQHDIRDKDSLNKVFEQNKFDAVLHLAGLKSVNESISAPLDYYDNNVVGSVSLFAVMEKWGVNNLVFSSSATVYGVPKSVPVTEEFPLNALTPYGATKLMIEMICKDIAMSSEWNIIVLRYFNPVGEHNSGLLRESPKGIPNNLFPYIREVIEGTKEELKVFGGDYPTNDGTGVRDYIHVVDLAEGHLKALDALKNKPGINTYNLGTGVGYSVKEIIEAFEKVNDVSIKYKVVDRRHGDVAICYADVNKAKNDLGWVASRGIEEMVRLK